MPSSVKIQVSNYAILEYIYGDTTSSINDYTFVKLNNPDRKVNIFPNEDKAATLTKNVLDYTFIETDDVTRFAHADRDLAFNLEELSDDIDLNDSLGIPTTYSVTYDKVRLHILAGYNLNGLDGIGVRISGEENSGLKSYLASHIYTIGENTLVQSSEPFSISEQVYDKYVEFLVPSLSQMNSDFYSQSTITNLQLASYLTSDGKGFKKESPIYVDFYQFYDAQEVNDILTYSYDKVIETSLSQVDNNSLISAVIQDSDEGDYYEYFATYNGEFIDDYLSELASLGTPHVIINDIKVYESYADLTRVKVDDVSTIQDSNFDKPNLFRPIISDEAIGFTIDYTMRLVNKVDNTQVIKESSITGNTELARRYGRRMTRINVKESSAPIKIYNRITNAVYDATFDRGIPSTTAPQQREVIRFVKEYNISTSTSHSIINTGNIIKDKAFNDDNYIYPNGKGLMYISNFDNYIKLSIFNRRFDGSDEALEITSFLNKSNGAVENLALVFYANNGSKKYIYPHENNIEGNQVTFSIKSVDSTKIQEYNNQRFSLIYINAAGNEISLFEGNFVTSIEAFENRKQSLKGDAIDTKVKEIVDVYDSTQRKLDIAKQEVERIGTSTSSGTPFISPAPPREESTVKLESSGTEIKNSEFIRVEDAPDFRKDIIPPDLEDAIRVERQDILKNARVDFVKATKDLLNKEISVVKENLSEGLKLDLTNKVNVDSKFVDIQKLNLTEPVGKNTNFYLDTSVKKIKPTFLKDLNIQR